MKCFKSTGQNRKKIDTLDFIKIKNFCTSKDILNGPKGNPQRVRKYFYITYHIRD